MRLLVAEDDTGIAGFLKKGLTEANYVVDLADNGEDALHMAGSVNYDLIIMDLMLPKIDGLTVIERLRNQAWHGPVLILSAKRSVDDRVNGLRKGGDDYLTKPFSFAELLARIAALLRRSNQVIESTTLSLGDITLDFIRREVRRGDKLIELQPREFLLLEYLMRHPNQPVSKTLILEHVWDFNFDPQTNVVDVLVCRLRNKIDRDYPEKRIITLRSVGYVFRYP